MPTIVLNTGNDELLGFLMIAGNDPVSSGAKKRDCIFTGVPKDPSLLDLPASNFLQMNKNQEFGVALEFDQSVIGLSISINNMLSFQATIAETDDGSWYFIDGETPTEIGRCKLL